MIASQIASPTFRKKRQKQYLASGAQYLVLEISFHVDNLFVSRAVGSSRQNYINRYSGHSGEWEQLGTGY